MKAIRKLVNNYSSRAFSVLGPVGYLRYLGSSLLRLPQVMRAGDLRVIDAAMGTQPVTVNFRGKRVIIDCEYCDATIKDGTFAFGAIRELIIRNCYLREEAACSQSPLRTVIDLGANRGVFSTMIASLADRVIAVEASPEYVNVIQHNMEVNSFTNYAIESAVVGSGGMCDSESLRRMSLPELYEIHNVESVDLLKIDIEGSEFGLFENADWLNIVSALCMEVHRSYGDVHAILKELHTYGFSYTMTNDRFVRVEDPSSADFVFARCENKIAAIAA